MKYTKYLILLISLVLILFSLNSVLFKPKKDKIIENNNVKIKEKKVKLSPKPISIKDLTLKQLWSYYLINPCYLPLLKDSSLWEKGTRVGFDYDDLFNDSLPINNKYRNRYLVGDFNVLDLNLKNKQVQEIYPPLNTLKDFDGVPKDIVTKMDTTLYNSPRYYDLIKEMRARMKDSAEIYINFLEKVWQYRMVPIKREFSVEKSDLFAAGQSLILCEACKDTLIMLSKFSVSSKRQDIALKINQKGEKVKSYFEYLPYGKRRKYYAGLNRITSKNWETERKYEKLDIQRDVEVGGGNNRVTFYDGKAQLPNFLLIKPSKEYKNAMNGNGIHEVSLRTLARGMLGTANSIGCIRVSDFGSKFLRWWVPQNCNFFISFDDKRYHKKIDIKGDIIDYLPFKNQEQGDRFRKWINKYKPNIARLLEIKETGDYRNGFIIDAYYYHEKDYNSYLKNNQK